MKGMNKLRSEDGKLYNISDGELMLIDGLKRLPIDLQLSLLELSKCKLEDYWLKQRERKLQWCLNGMKKARSAESGEKIDFRERAMWNCLGLSVSYEIFWSRIRRGHMCESDLSKIFDYLNSWEVILPD